MQHINKGPAMVLCPAGTAGLTIDCSAVTRAPLTTSQYSAVLCLTRMHLLKIYIAIPYLRQYVHCAHNARIVSPNSRPDKIHCQPCPHDRAQECKRALHCTVPHSGRSEALLCCCERGLALPLTHQPPGSCAGGRLSNSLHTVQARRYCLLVAVVQLGLRRWSTSEPLDTSSLVGKSTQLKVGKRQA